MTRAWWWSRYPGLVYEQVPMVAQKLRVIQSLAMEFSSVVGDSAGRVCNLSPQKRKAMIKSCGKLCSSWSVGMVFETLQSLSLSLTTSVRKTESMFLNLPLILLCLAIPKWWFISCLVRRLKLPPWNWWRSLVSGSGFYRSWTYGSRIQSVPVAPLNGPRPVASASVALFAS